MNSEIILARLSIKDSVINSINTNNDGNVFEWRDFFLGNKNYGVTIEDDEKAYNNIFKSITKSITEFVYSKKFTRLINKNEDELSDELSELLINTFINTFNNAFIEIKKEKDLKKTKRYKILLKFKEASKHLIEGIEKFGKNLYKICNNIFQNFVKKEFAKMLILVIATISGTINLFSEETLAGLNRNCIRFFNFIKKTLSIIGINSSGDTIVEHIRNENIKFNIIQSNIR